MAKVKLNFFDNSSMWYTLYDGEYYIDNDGYISRIKLEMANKTFSELLLVRHSLNTDKVAREIFDGARTVNSTRSFFLILQQFANKMIKNNPTKYTKWMGPAGVVIGSAEMVSDFFKNHNLGKKEGYYDVDGKLIVTNILKKTDMLL